MLKHVLNQSTESELSNVDNDMAQPNAIDIRIDRVFAFKDTRSYVAVIGEDDDNPDKEIKVHRKTEEMNADLNGWMKLPPGSYPFTTQHEITVGANEAGWVITRSTLNRNGVFISSGLFDSSYVGGLDLCLHVFGGPIWIKRGTRVGQYVCVDAESIKEYDGDYGKGKSQKSKGNTRKRQNALKEQGDNNESNT